MQILIICLLSVLVIALFSLAFQQEKIIVEIEKEKTVLQKKVDALEKSVYESYVFPFLEEARERPNEIKKD